MVAVKEFSWEEVAAPNFENPARRAWREAVAEIAEKAKTTLPQCNGRVEKAVAIVLNGDVELLSDGKAKVASQSNGTTKYFIVNGECSCPDYPKAPQGFCKHRLAYGIHKRAYTLANARLDAGATGQAPPAQPNAPIDTPQSVPAQHVVVIQGRPFVKFAGLLQMAHERGLVALTAAWTYNDAELSLAHAVATVQDGRRFEESGDASPSNTNKKVAVQIGRAHV